MKRDIILNTALRMFAEKGFAGTSTAALAKEAKVAEGTIFRHFVDKEAIFSEILSILHQKICQEFEASVTAANPETGLDTIAFAVSDFMGFIAENRDYLSIFFCEAPTRYIEQKSVVFTEISKIYEYINSFFATQLKRGMADGSVRNDVNIETSTVLMTCSVIGLARARHFGLVSMDNVYVEQLVDNIARSLK
ncbi:TetR/AcrR family transcriptional regulator [Desulfovibrio sp. OttesenSCG-928-F07]|nr:TetR/AcrR family transcriptional regulator [Desulfovibrio sp. OttesenSCG-928-F07]